MKNSNIKNIISKQIIEGLTGDEQQVLDNWLAGSEDNKKEYNAYLGLWTKSEDLVLSEKIDVESSLIKTKRQIGFPPRRSWITYARQAAAVLALSVALTFFYNYLIKSNPHKDAGQVVYQEINASYGTRTKVVLSDGSRVWLNSGSMLRFPVSFKESERRQVFLNGEGYFDVEKNKEKPFIVNTSKLDVKVYGTSFNVSAYENYDLMTVALEEGKVSLVKNTGGNEKELMVLKPNEVAEYNNSDKKIYHSKENSLNKYTAWKDGKIVFLGDPIDAVIRCLEKWYNVDIEVADEELESYRFTATFIDESLDQVLNLLSLSSASGIKYEIIPAQKQPDNSYSKRKVIMSKKE